MIRLLITMWRAFSRGTKIMAFGVGLMILGWALPDLVEKFFPAYLELLRNVTILDGDFFDFSKIALLISGAVLVLIGGRINKKEGLGSGGEKTKSGRP